MGKKENLYAKEFMDYYMNLGVDHMFIYDDNEPFSEKIKDVMDYKYKNKISFYEANKLNIHTQAEAFTNCYNNNLRNYDWFIMADMDEYLYIVNDTLKSYLLNKVFDKCDFIKIHWVNARDNNLLYYDSRPLSVRFPRPYIKNKFVKSIIRGNITNLTYCVHSPDSSPYKNVTCNNEGNIIDYNYLNFEFIEEININKSYFIHYLYKSTEEFINKYKRGYSKYLINISNNLLRIKLHDYLQENEITLEKINMLEKELKVNLSSYRYQLSNKTFTQNSTDFEFVS